MQVHNSKWWMVLYGILKPPIRGLLLCIVRLSIAPSVLIRKTETMVRIIQSTAQQRTIVSVGKFPYKFKMGARIFIRGIRGPIEIIYSRLEKTNFVHVCFFPSVPYPMSIVQGRI